MDQVLRVAPVDRVLALVPLRPAGSVRPAESRHPAHWQVPEHRVHPGAVARLLEDRDAAAADRERPRIRPRT